MVELTPSLAVVFVISPRRDGEFKAEASVHHLK